MLVAAVGVVYAAVAASEFKSVHEAHAAFVTLSRAFQRYDARMRRAAPVYGPADSGPPFDMWHSLEMLDRCRTNISLLMDESDAWWDTLLLDNDIP